MAILQRDKTPTVKTAFTKTSMTAFIKDFGTKEEKEWFKALLKENIVKVPNNLKDGEIGERIDWTEVRKAFIKKIYPDFDKAKKEKAKAKREESKKSLTEWIDSI